MKLKIGKRLLFDVRSIQEASRIYCEERDKSGEGARTFPDGKIDRDYFISYNGKVWQGKRLIFSPYWKPEANEGSAK